MCRHRNKQVINLDGRKLRGGARAGRFIREEEHFKLLQGRRDVYRKGRYVRTTTSPRSNVGNDDGSSCEMKPVTPRINHPRELIEVRLIYGSGGSS